MKMKLIDKYIKCAKINQENLWKRRQIEWKTSFTLWTALVVLAGFVYKFVNLPPEQSINWIVLIVIILLYIAITCLHRRHIKAHFISNEKDLDFIRYYLTKVIYEIEKINGIITQDEPQKPDWSLKSANDINEIDNYIYRTRKNKMKHSWTPVFVTIIIEIISLLLFSTKVYITLFVGY